MLSAIADDGRGPPIRAVARDARISPFHFIRQFEALFGSTPHQFRIRSRLDAAKALLAAGRMSVTEVCMRIGFSSLGTFSDLFSRRVGEAPSRYQRRLQATPDRFPGCLGLMGELPLDAFNDRNFREAGAR
ncbi:MAG TPA: AraC family transcriptional regulator [Polyangia bacterium]|nr:AraC family transcriptional regulator [Polyangia bacterium]